METDDAGIEIPGEVWAAFLLEQTEYLDPQNPEGVPLSGVVYELLRLMEEV
jgi:hypothetical protein